MEKQSSDNEILRFIDKYGIEDKDSSAPPKKRKKRSPYQKVGKKLRRVLDLHGKTQDEAIFLLRSCFQECQRKGVDSILIIHGIGHNSDKNEGPVLKKTVLDMLQNELCNAIMEYRTALPRDGGDGATVVRLKR